LQLWDTAGQ